MVSGLSKLADKGFIIGFYIPALLFVMAIAAAFNSVPWVRSWATSIVSDKSFTDLTYVAVGVWVLALLLMVANHEFYRILEGYRAPLSWCSWLTKRHQAMLRALQKQHEALLKSDAWAASRISWRLRKDYPPTEASVMPTLFGNRIRAFELYPNELYGADGVTVWPRLTTVLTSQVDSAINDAKAQVDFMLNCLFLAIALVVAAVLRLLGEWASLLHPCFPDYWVLIASVVLGLAAACTAYFAATARVVDWGEAVKSAFDCFLPALAKQLGYVLPKTAEKRKEFWDDVTQLTLYHRPIIGGKWSVGSP